MEKKINNFLFFMALFILYTFFSNIVIYFLKYFNIFDINSLSLHYKNLCLIIIDIILMIITYLFYRKDCNNDIRSFIKNFFSFFKTAMGFWIFGLSLMIISNLLINYFYPTSRALNEDAVQNFLKTSPIYASFASCIFAPFMEEMIFRKSLRNVFSIDILYIFVSGLLFGLVHNLASIGTSNFIYIIPYGLFGSIFAYCYVKTKNIFVPIMIHCIHNTVLVIISLYQLGVIK